MVADNATRRIVAERLARYPDTPAIRRLGDVAVPTLIVHGNRDHPEIASIADLLVARMPGAAGEVVPGVDHYLPLRAPRPLTGLLRAHLKSASG